MGLKVTGSDVAFSCPPPTTQIVCQQLAANDLFFQYIDRWLFYISITIRRLHILRQQNIAWNMKNMGNLPIYLYILGCVFTQKHFCSPKVELLAQKCWTIQPLLQCNECMIVIKMNRQQGKKCTLAKVWSANKQAGCQTVQMIDGLKLLPSRYVWAVGDTLTWFHLGYFDTCVHTLMHRLHVSTEDRMCGSLMHPNVCR